MFRRRFLSVQFVIFLCLLCITSWCIVFLVVPAIKTTTTTTTTTTVPRMLPSSQPIRKVPRMLPSSQPARTDQCGRSWQEEYCKLHDRALRSRKRETFLSYHCHGGCGGVGNRVRGIVSVFYLALLTDRAFLIHWGGPGQLEEHLEPNQINWSVPLENVGQFHMRYWGVIGAPRGYDGKDSRGESEANFLNWVSKADAGSLMRHPLEAIGTIWNFAEQLRSNPFLNARAKELGIPSSPWRLFGCAFRFLFKKSSAMIKALDEARLSLSRKPPLLGIHIRTSDHHFGSATEYSYRSRNASSFLVCAQQQNKLIRENLNLESTELKWFLAADDNAVKVMAKKIFPAEVVTLDIMPKHIVFNSISATDVRNIFMDIFLLSESNYLLLTFGSTFSEIAAGVGLHDEHSIADGEKCLVNKTSFLEIISRVAFSKGLDTEQVEP